MSLERPWEKSFMRLMEELDAKWVKGTGEPSASSSKEDELSVGIDIWTYPSYVRKRGDEQIVVSISEFPAGGGDLIDAADNWEFLRLSVRKPLKARLTLRHEGFVDRFMKRIKIEWEYQTGNKEFDRKYYIVDAVSDRDRALVSKPEFQKLVEQLEPFAAIALSDTGAHWSVAIEHESVLSLQRIDECLGRLSKLAELADKQR